jgi:hypothetical protein
MLSRSVTHLLGAGILLMTGCAGGTDAGGNVYVDSAAALSLAEDLRIGSADDPTLGFTRISSVIGREDGSVYALESREKQLRLYSAAGTLVRTIGRAGDGPGEFRTPTRMGRVGETVWVFDLSQEQITLFDTLGNVARIIASPSMSVEAAPGIRIDVSGASLRADGTLGSDWSYMAMAGGPTDTLHAPHVRFDTTGAPLDTIAMELWTYPAPVTVGGDELVAPSLPSSLPLPVASGLEYFHIDRRVAAAAGNGTFTIARTGSRGDTLSRRSYSYTPKPFTREVLDTIIARRVNSLMRYGNRDAGALEAAFRAVLHAPAFLPPIVAARAGDDGVLWLQREDLGGPSAHWLLIAPDGKLIGTLDIPRNIAVRWSSGDIVWAVLTDELEVPWLVRYRLGKHGR